MVHVVHIHMFINDLSSLYTRITYIHIHTQRDTHTHTHTYVHVPEEHCTQLYNARIMLHAYTRKRKKIQTKKGKKKENEKKKYEKYK